MQTDSAMQIVFGLTIIQIASWHNLTAKNYKQKVSTLRHALGFVRQMLFRLKFVI